MVVRLFLTAAVVASLGGCAAKKQQRTVPTASRPSDRERSTGTASAGGTQGQGSSPGELRAGAIYFQYDKALIDKEAGDALERLGDLLKENPSATVTIEGHADERGTPEYNIALGDERARAAKSFLVRLGVDESRVSTVSYGEERPAVMGDDESAWHLNRRAEFQITSAVSRRR